MQQKYFLLLLLAFSCIFLAANKKPNAKNKVHLKEQQSITVGDPFLIFN
jgi:hypothetical protein